MKIRGFGYALSISAAAFLAACGGSQPPISAPGAIPQSRIEPTSNYQVLHTFDPYSKGAHPKAGLLDVDGTLYGTTYGGGKIVCYFHNGCGTVYTMTTAGVERVLHRFEGGSDAAKPLAGLINLDGTLYGTSSEGGTGCGKSGCGTVYSISKSGTETVPYRFTGGADGAYPTSDLTDVNGTLYGTTEFGGVDHCYGVTAGCGTVYSVSMTGAEHILHRFKSGSDGEYPIEGLINVNGTLYGTTSRGGGKGCCGTVYSITTRGSKKLLYRFTGNPDGSGPAAALIDVNETLYGTTALGGTESKGTVYSLSTNGVEKVLHSFGEGQDGAYPVAPLIYVKGRLYGTAELGAGPCRPAGCGALYSINMQGLERVLHVFAGGSDGCKPDSGLIDVNGTLYGTTEFGGRSNRACTLSIASGTVFKATP